MVFKELLIFSACLYVELVFADEHRSPRCRSHATVCPCGIEKHGVKLNVTIYVKTCNVDGDHISLTRRKSACNQEEILTKCRRAYLSSERHRRNADSEDINCLNGTIIKSESSLALKGPPKVKIAPSRFAFVDKDVQLKCSVNSNLSATVSWLFNGKALVAIKNRHSYLECKTVLLISRVLSKDDGNYTCVVRNKAGQANASSYLSVKTKNNLGPYIEYMKLEGDHGNTAFTGTTVNLTCKAQNYLVQNKLYKNGSEIKEDDGKHYKYFHMPDRNKNVKIVNLEIKNVTMEDAGNYTCFAVYVGPPKCATFHLKVEICNPGYYCPAGSVQPIRCPWGTYQPKKGQSSPLACKQCPDFDKLNKSDPSQNPPARNITDCPSAEYQPTGFVKEDKQPPSTSKSITPLEITGIVAGMVGTGFIVLLAFYCIAKKKRWLSHYSSSSRTSNQHDAESLPCEPVFTNSECQRQSLCENMQNAAECVQIVKKAPEIDYEPKYDVFICYSYKDVSWVKELFAELEKRGFTCCIDFKDFLPGAPIVENISQAICYSRKTIAVLTPDFVESNWCSHELQKALTRIRFHQVVPVVYKSCEIPLILRDRTYLDWENCHVKPYFWDQLEKALRQPNDKVLDM